jgi:hypothetical protein
MHVKEWHCVPAKAACTLIKHDSGLGSCLSLSSLLSHPCDQCTTHKCLPFSPTTPPTFLTWPRRGDTGVTVLRVWAGYSYYTFHTHCMISLHFLRNDSVVRSLLLYTPKNINLLSLFFSEMIIPWKLWVRTKNSEWMTWENDASRNDASDTITHCLYGHCARTRDNERYLQENNAYGNGG